MPKSARLTHQPNDSDVESRPSLWDASRRSLTSLVSRVGRKPFEGSVSYWEGRYANGGNSGKGSYGESAIVKAETINALVISRQIDSVIDFGCGDGSQLSLAKYPKYVGLDVSATAIRRCLDEFVDDETKQFYLYGPHTFASEHPGLHAEMALSLEVLFHIVEDELFDLYIRHLFGAAERVVVIMSDDEDSASAGAHVRRRAFSPRVAALCPTWTLDEVIPNPRKNQAKGSGGTRSDFYVYTPQA